MLLLPRATRGVYTPRAIINGKNRRVAGTSSRWPPRTCRRVVTSPPAQQLALGSHVMTELNTTTVVPNAEPGRPRKSSRSCVPCGRRSKTSRRCRRSSASCSNSACGTMPGLSSRRRSTSSACSTTYRRRSAAARRRPSVAGRRAPLGGRRRRGSRVPQRHRGEQPSFAGSGSCSSQRRRTRSGRNWQRIRRRPCSCRTSRKSNG